MRPATIHGYADRLSVAPLEPIEFKVSTDVPGTYRADVVRLIHGDTNPAGPGFKERVVDSPANGDYEGRYQPIRSGSHVTVLDEAGQLALTGPFSIHVFAMPTTPGKGVQRILGRMAAGGNAGYALEIAGGRLRLTVGDGSATQQIESDTPLHRILLVLLRRDVRPRHRRGGDLPGARAQLVQQPALPHRRDAGPLAGARCRADRAWRWERELRHRGRPGSRQPLQRQARQPQGLAARARRGRARCAHGRRRPAPAAGLAAHWDFSDGIGAHGVPTDHVRDVGGHDLSGVCVNQPARGMTGWNWDCSEECYRHAPQLYGAIHFHDDDLDDCGWETDIALTIPDDMRSGVYALRIRQGEAEDRIPFFVIPPRGTATGEDRLPRADGELSRLRERPHRPRRAGGPVDPGSHLVHLRAGLLPLRQPRSRALDLRLALRRQRRLLLLVPTADHEHAAGFPARHRLGLAVPRRSPPRRLARARRATPTTS